ncbi:MAG: PA14 domain-containing protein, partial [Anaerolineae bacterium]|nr:PA14 domain-containing protein [Anaerolineae bacterium]
MKRILTWFVVALALLANTLPAVVMASPPAQDPGWFAEYFANHSLAGPPVLTRYEPSIDYVWGTGSPSAAVPIDQFSVRWTRTMNFTAGTYNFCATVDDGVRFWVDGQ